MAVEQPDGDEGEPEVVGRLEVVAGEHAEAAGVLGQGGGDAELRREVGDLAQGAVDPLLEPPGTGQALLQLVVHGGRQGGEGGVLGQPLEVLAGLGGQDQRGVAPLELVALAVEAPEQVVGPLVVGPAEVHGDRPQRLQPGRELGHHGERLDGLHGRRTVAGPARTRRRPRRRPAPEFIAPKPGGSPVAAPGGAQAAEPSRMASSASAMWRFGRNCDEKHAAHDPVRVEHVGDPARQDAEGLAHAPLGPDRAVLVGEQGEREPVLVGEAAVGRRPSRS